MGRFDVTVEWFSTLEQARELANGSATSVDVRCTVPDPESDVKARKLVAVLTHSKLAQVRIQLPTAEKEIGWALEGAVVPRLELVDRRQMNHEVTYAFTKSGELWSLEVTVPVVAKKVMGAVSTALEGVFAQLEPTLATIPREKLAKVSFTPKPKTAPPAARKRLDAISKNYAQGRPA